MLPQEQPDRIQIAFDDQRLVGNTGLLLPVTLAHHLALGELVDRRVDLARLYAKFEGSDGCDQVGKPPFDSGAREFLTIRCQRRCPRTSGYPVPLSCNLFCVRYLKCVKSSLGDAPGHANAGDKVLTLVASALAGGDRIDDADVLRAGGTEQVLGCTVKAPSMLGTFLRSFQWGHVRQLDRVSREVLARAWATGAGPGDDPLTIDLDSIRRRRMRPTG